MKKGKVILERVLADFRSMSDAEYIALHTRAKQLSCQSEYKYRIIPGSMETKISYTRSDHKGAAFRRSLSVSDPIEVPYSIVQESLLAS